MTTVALMHHRAIIAEEQKQRDTATPVPMPQANPPLDIGFVEHTSVSAARPGVPRWLMLAGAALVVILILRG